MMHRQAPASVSGQASEELRAALHQRLVRIEGPSGPNPLTTARGPDCGEASSSPRNPNKAIVPRIPVSVTRSTSVPDTTNVPKDFMSARVVRSNGTGALAPPPPQPVTGSPNVNRQPSATGAPPPPCARNASGLGTAVLSPKNQRFVEPQKLQGEYRSQVAVEVGAGTPQKIQSDYRMPTMAEKLQREYRNATSMEMERADCWPTKVTVEAERADSWPQKGAVEVPVEECVATRLPVAADRANARSAQQFRGPSAAEVERDNAHRMRKVSCGKLYEELAYLRKENGALQRAMEEMEQRQNEEIPQQLADELCKLRVDNQALKSQTRELRDRISEYDENSCHDTLIGTTEMKLEELRQRQEAEAERNKDQLSILLHQNEKLNRELEDLRRERRELANSPSPTEEAIKQRNEVLSAEIEDLRREIDSLPPKEQLEQLNGQLQEAQRRNSQLRGELESARGCHAKDVSNLREENKGLQRICSELEGQAAKVEKQQEELQEQRRQSNSLIQENRRLSLEVEQISTELRSSEERRQSLEEERKLLEQDRRKSVEEVRRLSIEIDRRKSLDQEQERRKSFEPEEEEEVDREVASPCSHSRLKSVLTDRRATVDDLRNAIGAAEALLGEARREFASKQLRERRACFERLHGALEGDDEAVLAEAIAAARRAEIDAEDIVKGEAKLAILRSMNEEQRRAKALHELSLQRKKEAFLLVKKDDAVALHALLHGLDEAVRWRDWRDYNGRTLWRFAVEMRAARVQESLGPLLGMQAPQEKRRLRVPEPAPRAPSAEKRPQTTPQPAAAPASEAEPRPAEVEAPAQRVEEAPAVLPPVTEAEEAQLKVKAFRAVVQDNTTVLLEVLGRLNVDVWSTWQNKASKDLLTLSQERGSSGAYSVLAKALGLVQEQKRESFDEREAVWIFAQGEVQPRRATVLEDTPEEADEVLVEYWDGDDPAIRVDRCLVRKMWS